MFGIKDPTIIVMFFFLFFAAVFCLVYGALNWNKGGEISPQELEEESKWDKEEDDIDSEVGGL
ncbi:MAG: hypothetical protein JXR63_01105 [Spirochaetales bacterium]|nr:hypothetical protein [Spirochaetales bacterium]